MDYNTISIAEKKIEGLSIFKPGKPIKEVEIEFNITNVIKLASNENPIGPSNFAIEVIKKSLKDLRLYPDGNSSLLKEKLANIHKINCDQITLGNGSEEVMNLIANIFTKKNDDIIISQNEFITYSLIAKKVGANSIAVPTKNWAYDLDEMLQSITPRTRLIFIANPKNPTGTRVNIGNLIKFLNAVPQRVLVVLDEAYFEYVQEKDHPNGVSLIENYPNLIVTRTFSKIYGLANLRIGYSISNPLIASLLNRVRMPFNINGLAQVAAEAALNDKEHIKSSLKVYQMGKKQIQDGLININLPYLPSFCNFITIELNKPSNFLYNELLSEGIIVRPLEIYGMPNHLRITIGTYKQNERFIKTLTKIKSKKYYYESWI